jgi:hypothetical protein
MICADFLAGANLDNEDPTKLLQSRSRFFIFFLANNGRMAGDVRFVVPDRTFRSTKSICVVSRARMTN